MPYDPVKSFAPVAKLATGWLALVVGKGFPATTPAELVALLKTDPGKYTYASSGVGTVIQFTTEMFLAAAGATATHVPYRGVGPALIDLADGRVDMMIAGLPTLVPQIESGRVRAIGVTAPKALRPAPGLPRCRRWPMRFPATKRVPGGACWRRPARRRLSSTCSTRR